MVPRFRFTLSRRRLAWAALVVLILLTGVAIFLSPALLRIESPERSADAIVLLGGEVMRRPGRAAELFAAGVAPKIIVTGDGDCDEVRQSLLSLGVPAGAILVECNSRSTQQNAKYSVPMLQALGARRVIIVTSWFHSRRALHTFQRFAPEMEFTSLPTRVDLPKSRWPFTRQTGRALYEYPKMLYYWVRFGIKPF
jgi:uncharacterized SAM-binding protein YcdF (DUF218 family)